MRFQRSVPGTTAKDVMNLVLMTQYFDMLEESGASSRRNAMIEAEQIGGRAGDGQDEHRARKS